MSGACRAANLSRDEVDCRREHDAAFRAAWAKAEREGIDRLQDEMRDLARAGEQIVETTTESGVTRTVRRTYDLASYRFLLKAADPERFGAHPRAGRPEALAPIGDDADPPRSERGLDR